MPDKTTMRLGSLILAGGRSTRMGRPKESLPFGGTTLLGHAAAMLGACTDPVVVVARGGDQALPALPPGVRVVPDERPDGGPLQGLATGLRCVRRHGLLDDGDVVFTMACDMPFVTPAVVAVVAETLGRADCAMPDVGGVLQPLLAVYRVGALAAIDARLSAGDRALRVLADHLDTVRVAEVALRAVDPELRCVESLDTEAAWRAAQLRNPG